ALSSTSFHTAAGKRTDRTTVVRLLPFPGLPRRRRTALGRISGISHNARSEGPPRSPAPEKAFRRAGPNRSKSTSPSSGSVVFIVRFFTFRSLSGADDSNALGGDLCVDHEQKPLLPRVSDEDESGLME